MPSDKVREKLSQEFRSTSELVYAANKKAIDKITLGIYKKTTDNDRLIEVIDLNAIQRISPHKTRPNQILFKFIDTGEYRYIDKLKFVSIPDGKFRPRFEKVILS